MAQAFNEIGSETEAADTELSLPSVPLSVLFST
jgi:hypothetical protein